MKEFSQSVCEKIQYYVYVLRDPRNKNIFYIGKGVNNRIFNHVNAALDGSTENDKLNLIREIIASGLAVDHFVLRHGLTEGQALEIESACIDLIGLKNLTNEVKGHHSWDSGLKSVDEIVQYYDAPEAEITEPTIIININKKYERGMSEQDLYEATRSAWKLSDKTRKSVQYAIASYRGMVREVYKIDRDGWSRKDDRWEFTGQKDDGLVGEKYRNASLKKYIKHGNQNPIRLVGIN